MSPNPYEAPPAARGLNLLWRWREFQHLVRAEIAAHGWSVFKQPFYPGQRGSDRVRALLQSGRPVLCARFGFLERECAWYFHTQRAAGQPYPERLVRSLPNNAGFFPATPEAMDRFSRIYLEAVAQVDLMCVWMLANEAAMCQAFCPQAKLTDPGGFEPYYVRRPWTTALAGRRVLVIHPFHRSIEAQYRNARRLLFRHPDVLPEFELQAMPSVVSLAGNPVPFPDWFAALEHMKEQVAARSFDVAIIGAGSYGLVLGAYIKSLGRQAVHLGGATQVLFGIRGRRWDEYPRSARLCNEHWVRPQADEVPAGAAKVENGCYW